MEKVLPPENFLFFSRLNNQMPLFFSLFFTGSTDEDKVVDMKSNISRESDRHQLIRLLFVFLVGFQSCSGQVPGSSSKPPQVQSQGEKTNSASGSSSNLPFLSSQPAPTTPSSSSFVPDFISSINQNNQRSLNKEDSNTDSPPLPPPQAQVQGRPPFSNFNSIDDEQRSNDRDRLRTQQDNNIDRTSDDFLRNRDRGNVRGGQQGFGDRGENRTFNTNRFQPGSTNGEREQDQLPFGRNPRPQDPFSSFGPTTNRNRIPNQDPRQRIPDQGFTSFNNNNNQRGSQTPAFPFGGSSTGPNFNFNQNTRNTLIKEP